MIQEFKKFIMRGNVVDLAVGIIIGSAFKDITKSLVNDVIMPPVGQLVGGVDFSEWKIDLGFLGFANPEAAAEASAATLNIGLFVNTVIDFMIIAVAVFALIKVVNKLDEAVDEIGDMLDGDEPEPEPEPEAEPEPSTEEKLVAVLEKLSAQLDKA